MLVGCAATNVRVERQGPLADVWRLPDEDLATQRVFRARLRSAEGGGRLRLILRLESPDRYTLDAAHPLFNRKLWSLEVLDGRALLVDFMQKAHCLYEGEIEIAALPLGPFPFATLPALLLGFVPQQPASRVRELSPGQIEFRDARRRFWTVSVENGRVRGWRLWDAGQPTVEWRLEERWATLTAADRDLRLRWRETLREPLSGDLRALEVPPGSSAGSCDLGWISEVEGTLEEGDLD